MRKSVGCLLLFTLSAACLAQQNASSTHFDGKSWWAHVKFLADDSLEGRNTGQCQDLCTSLAQFPRTGLFGRASESQVTVASSVFAPEIRSAPRRCLTRASSRSLIT
jgi:hypothetical protein